MQDIIEERGIKHLYHFTQAQNLTSIVNYGLLPKDDLEFCGIAYSNNDSYRYDECTNAVCTSVEFPNYKMFYSLRKGNPNSEWAVIELDARILYEYDCIFCWTNAGDYTMYSKPIEQRIGRDAFANLFGDCSGYPKRKSLGIPDCYPTNPQAEVLVCGTIHPEYIKRIYFENKTIYDKYIDALPPAITTWRSYIFGPRKDWAFW